MPKNLKFVKKSNPNDTFPIIDEKVYVKNQAFSSIKNSFINLLVLITTSNNPDGTF